MEENYSPADPVEYQGDFKPELGQLLTEMLTATGEEGKIIDGKINKITEKFVFLFVEGLKSEPVLDINGNKVWDE